MPRRRYNRNHGLNCFDSDSRTHTKDEDGSYSTPPPEENYSCTRGSKVSSSEFNGASIVGSFPQDLFDLNNEQILRTPQLDEIRDSFTISSEIIRTYKVGLRVPESLLKEQNKLIIQREVLQYLRKSMNGKCTGNSLKDKIYNANSKVKEIYKHEFDTSRNSTYNDILNKLHENRQKLRELNQRSQVLNSSHFTKADMPKFTNIAKPLPSEISLRDYQYLANNSLKMICKHLNTVAQYSINHIHSTREAIVELALKIAQQNGINYSTGTLNKYFHKSIALIIGSHSNINLTAFYQLANNLESYFTLRDKVDYISKFFNTSNNFSEAVPILFGYYSIPNHFKKFLAKTWNVDSHWVRNLFVGWRRKLDSLLSEEFQIESLTNLFLELASFYKRFARNLNDIKIISILQKNHVLHLLPYQIDLTPLLPNDLFNNYYYLRDNVKCLPSALEEYLTLHTHQIGKNLFLQSINQLISDVQKNKLQFLPVSISYKNCEAFIHKLELITQKVNLSGFEEILKNFIIGNRFTHSISKLFYTSKVKHLFTAFRGIISLTLAKMYPNAIGQFKSIFNPDNCLTRPFQSKKRKKNYLPINLIFNKYVIERKDNPNSGYYLINQYHSDKPNVTEIFRQGIPIWLGLPIYSPKQFKDGLLEGCKKGTFWFQLIPSKKIVECLNRGAEVRNIRLNMPNGPSYKVVADIEIASKNRSAFMHRGKFLKTWDYEYLNLQVPKNNFLGVDFNRIGKFMVAVANPESEINILSIMDKYQKAYTKLEKYRRWEIPNIQKKLEVQSLNPRKQLRLKTQITLLHQKRKHIMREMKRHALMLYFFIAYKSNANYLSWDSIDGISPRDKSGTLANSITYLPKNKELFELFNEWAQDLIDQDYLTQLRAVIPVSSFTSQVCGDCFKLTGKMRKTRSQSISYDEFLCTECKKSSNRHSNSAQVSAVLLQNYIQSQVSENNDYTPSPLTMG